MSGNKGTKPPTTIIQSFDKVRESPRIAAKTDKGPKAMEPEVIKGGAKPTATVSASSDDAAALQKQLITLIKEMDDKLSNRLDELDTKFTGMFNGMKVDIESMRTDMDKTTTQLNELTVKVGDMETSLSFHSNQLDDVKKQTENKISDVDQKFEKQMKELNDKLMLLEKHERKYNLLLYGIAEKHNENIYETVRDIFRDDLNIDGYRVENMYFVAGHRIPSKGTGPKPIILRFCSSDDAELVLANSYKLGGSKRRILVDLPLPMKQERARLAKAAFNIRKKEKLQTRIRVKDLDVYLQVRKDENQYWARREIEKPKQPEPEGVSVVTGSD